MADNHPRTPRNPPAHGEITATQTSLAIPPQELPTATRTIRRTVTFSWPFMLSGIASIQPAGTYAVETDEELVQETPFPVFRRTATLMLLPALPAGPVLAQIATIDPLELEVALERDAMKGVP
jgi:hypothetical protein